MSESTRDRFEKWVKQTRWMDASRNPDGYTDSHVQIAWEAWHEADASMHLIRLLGDIRAAVGDPEGKLDWPGLVEHCRKLKASERSAVFLLVRLATTTSSTPAREGFSVLGDHYIYDTPVAAVEAAIAEEIERGEAER